MAYFGMIDALERGMHNYAEWRQQLRGVVGTSAGSLCALVIALGLDADARRHILSDVMDVQNVLRRMDISLLATNFGMDDGHGLRDGVHAILTRGGLSVDSTLGDLKRLLRIEFVCVCTDLSTSSRICLASSTHPHVRVCDAVCASCAIPFVFCPVRIDGYVLADGALTCRLADDVFPKENTMFVEITSQEKKEPIQDWMSFLSGVLSCCMKHQDEHTHSLCDSEHGLCIFVPPFVTSSVFDITLDENTRHSIVQTGFVVTLDHILKKRLISTVVLALRTYTKFALSSVDVMEDEQPPDDALACEFDPRSL